MDDELKEMMNETLKGLLDKLDELEPGSEEWKEVSETISKMSKAIAEDDKNKIELANENTDNKFKHRNLLATVIIGAAGLGVQIWSMFRDTENIKICQEFEQTDSYSTLTSKQTVGNALRNKINKKK